MGGVGGDVLFASTPSPTILPSALSLVASLQLPKLASDHPLAPNQSSCTPRPSQTAGTRGHHMPVLLGDIIGGPLDTHYPKTKSPGSSLGSQPDYLPVTPA